MPTRKPSWKSIYRALRIARSPIVGRGLFTPVAIAKRAKIGEFEGEKIGLREARRRARGLKVIAIVELDKHALDATRSKRGFRFMNHSCGPNTFIRRTATRAEFYALRDIRKGEELTLDYGDNQHEGRLACRCGAPGCKGFL